MIELTKNQRLEAYRYARTELLEGEQFMCLALKRAVLNLEYYPWWIGSQCVYDTFPEFANQKPSMIAIDDIWFPEEDKASRVSVLNRIIEKMETELELA